MPAVASVLLGAAAWHASGWHLELEKSGPLLPGSFPFEFPGEQLTALSGSAGIALSAVGFGCSFGCRLLPSRGLQRLAVALLLGYAVTGTAILLAGLTVGTAAVPWVLAAGLALNWRFGWRAWWGGIQEQWRAAPGAERLAWFALAVLLVAAALPAFAPAWQSDGARYHLVEPQEWLKAGRVAYLPHQAFTNLPALANMLFLAGMQLANERAAQALHWSFLPLVGLFAGLLAVRLARVGADPKTRDRRVLPVAALAAVGSPVALLLAGWPFVDLAATAFVLGSAWAMCPGALRTSRARMALSGLLAGAAVASKLSAAPMAALLFLPIAGIAWSRRSALPAVLWCACAAVLVLPWLAKSWAFTGNPVYPAAWSIFGGGEWSAANAAFYASKAAEKGLGRGIGALALSPWNLSTRWEAFEVHNPGPALLAFLVPAALFAVAVVTRGRWRSPALAATVLLAGGGWVCWFYGYQSTRFALVPIVAVTVLGVAGLARLVPRALLVALVPPALGAAWFAVYVLFFAPDRPVAGALGFVPREETLPRLLNYYAATERLNLAETGRVVYIGEHRALYARYPVLHSDWFDTPFVLDEIRNTRDNDALLAKWRAEGVTHVLYNEAELSAYLEPYFRPRFSSVEWKRFTDLQARLRRCLEAEPSPRVFVCRLPPR